MKKIFIALLCLAFVPVLAKNAAVESTDQDELVKEILAQDAANRAKKSKSSGQPSTDQSEIIKENSGQDGAVQAKPKSSGTGQGGVAKAKPKSSGSLPFSLDKWFNVAMGYLANIGGLFGGITGFRIGGTTGSGVIALVIAQIIKEKAPWLKWILYLTGGTMFAGSGANILQAVTNGL